ncbi:MAG: T9SS C-terminal target domain-containing protein [Balneola sp.]|nr:MAG: T9SS C-terminal target domain-containing protein [Balneola sp.]
MKSPGFIGVCILIFSILPKQGFSQVDPSISNEPPTESSVSLTLTIGDNSDYGYNFDIYRDGSIIYSDPGSFATSIDFEDTSLDPGTTYDYYGVVTLLDSFGGDSTSQTSTTIQVTTLPKPSVVSNVQVDSSTYGQITVIWDQNSESDFMFYNVYRETSSTSSPGNVLTTINLNTTTSYIDNSVADGTTYFYYVTVVNNDGVEGDISNEASTTSLYGLNYITNSSSSFAGLWSPLTPIDYDNDGDLDLFYTGIPSSGTIASKLYDNDGSGTFTENTNHGLPAIHSYVSQYFVWGDYDNDGDLDIILAGDNNSVATGTRQIHSYTNNGDGTFSAKTNLALIPAWYPAMDFGDYDNDGDLDLFVTGQTGSGVLQATLYDNDGDGNFSVGSQSFTGVETGAVEWVDYDNDGDLDLTYFGNDITTGSAGSFFYINNGDGTFTEETVNSPLKELRLSAISWADFNNDGFYDVFISGFHDGNSPSRVNQLYKNNGDGTFSLFADAVSGIVNQTTISWGDYDTDGDLDLLISGYDQIATTYSAKLFENSGSSGGYTFSESTTLPGVEAYSSAWIDLDGDTDLDAVFAISDGVNPFEIHLFENHLNKTSTTAAPTNLSWTETADSVTFSWDAVADPDGGPVSYNLYLTEENLANREGVPSHSNNTTGARRLFEHGNMGLNTSFTISKDSLQTAIYEWGVQSVDATWQGSSFTTGSDYSITVAKPANLSALFTSSLNKVDLSWDANTEPGVQYEVYRIDETNATTTKISTTSSTSLSDYPPAPNNYTYFLKAVVAVGIESVTSDSAIVAAYPDATTPSALDTTSTSISQVVLEWSQTGNEPATGENYSFDLDKFEVYRDSGAIGTGTMLLANPTSPSYTDNSVTAGATYYYYVRALEPVTPDTSGFSDTLVVTLSLPAAPTAPTNLVASKNLYNNVTLSWDASTSEANIEYDVYRTDAGLIGTTSNTSFADGTVASNTAYEYSVKAKDEFNQESASSNTVNVTTPSFIIADGSISGLTAAYGSDAETADFDGDGDLDIVLAGYNNGTVGGVYLNDGTGAFATPIALPTFYWDDNSRFDPADYDGDGDIDLASTYRNSGDGSKSVFILNNNGSGSFSYSGIGFTEFNTGDPSWGDVDNDGDLDLFIPATESKLYINSNGTFIDSGQSFNSASDTKAHWADYNNDGYQDLLLVGGTSLSTLLYVNDGNGNLSNSGESIVSSGFRATWRDINNDGYLDFAISTISSGIFIYENDGSGNFTGSQLTTSATLNNAEISFEDFDHDGDADAFVFGLVGSGTSAVYESYYFENNGDGTFAESELTAPVINFGATILLKGDFDNDGDLDFGLTGVFFNYSTFAFTYTAKKYINNVSNDLTNTNPSAPSNLTTSLNGTERTLSWNESTDAEGAISSYNVFIQETSSSVMQTPANSDTTTGYRMRGEPGNTGLNTSYIIDENLLPSGTYSWGVQALDGSYLGSAFTKGTSFTVTNPAPATPSGLTASNIGYTTVDLSWNDINESDAFYNVYRETASTGSPSNLIATTTDTTWADSSLADGTTFYYYIQAEDKAGQLSSVSSELSVETILQIFADLGNAGIPAFIYSAKSAWGDYDNDGDLDLAITGHLSNISIAKIYKNQGNGVFSDSGINLTGVTSGEISWVDVDNDGDLDLFLNGDGTATTALLYRNDGGDTFTEINTSIEKLTNNTVEWADYNNDGYIDLLLYGEGLDDSGDISMATMSTSIYSNNGDGTFQVESINLQEVTNGCARWLDVDSDHDLDIILSSDEGGKIYENDGFGSFNESGKSFPSLDECTLDIADYDQDGDIDVLIAGENNISNRHEASIYVNDGTGSFSDSGVSLEGVNMGKWVDFDNDGDLDVLLSGLNNSNTRATKTYLNDGNGNFSDEPNLVTNIDNLVLQDLEVADFDNDGDLDAFLLGYSENKFLENVLSESNTAPSIPANLSASANSQDVIINWDASTDPEGSPVSYNVFITEVDSINAIVSAASDTSNGFYRLNQLGNAGIANTFTINRSNDWEFPLIIGVQAIDASQLASDFTYILYYGWDFIQANSMEIMAYDDLIYTFDINALQLISGYSDSTFEVSQSGSLSGIFFKDVNNNRAFDGSSDVIVQNVSNITFSPSSGDTLRYFSYDPRIESASLIFSTAQYTDSLEIDIRAVKGNPQIEGNSNESGWYLLSNPFTTTIGELLENVWTQGAINSDAPDGASTLYIFNQDSSIYEAVTTDLDTTKLAAGQGLLVYLFEDDDLGDGEGDIDGGWPKTLSNYGDPFGEQVSVEIKNVDHDGFAGTSGSEGFALMGNPYGWHISADSVIATLKREDPFANSYIYRWDAVSKLFYLTTSGSIAPYESFFIRTITSGTIATLTLDYSDHVEVIDEADEEGEEGGGAEKAISEKKPVIVSFNLGSEEHETTSSFYLRFDDDANSSIDIDPFDGYYLGSYASQYANLYTKIGDQALSINNLPIGLDEHSEFPLYIDATLSGPFTLNWDAGRFPEDWKFSLEELATGRVIDLIEESGYSFEATHKSKYDSSLNPMVLDNTQSKQEVANTPVFMLRIVPANLVGTENGFGIPLVVELEQNYPNPFNPSSVIRFGVPTTSEVKLEVFDVLGRRVATLVNGETKQPGRYNIQFNARDLSSGMYIYRLVIGDKVLTKKMTLIK